MPTAIWRCTRCSGWPSPASPPGSSCGAIATSAASPTVAVSRVLVFAVVTLGVLAETGHRGGQINHPEIRVATDALPTDPNAGWSPAIELAINQVIWFVPWQTVHFFGYSLIFGTVFAVALRVLGFWKSLSFAAVHRLLPLGVLGVVMNVFSGMLMLLADTYRYS